MVYHEIGHTYASRKGISPARISRRILGGKGDSHDDYLKANLSNYSASRADGSEIIAEVFSAYFSGIDNEFAREFMRDVMTI